MNIVNVGYDSTNYYVIGQGRQRLLVDVGWPGTLPKLLANLRRAGIRLDELGFTGDLTPPGMATTEAAADVEHSWAKLWALKVHTIYPGHGPPRKMDTFSNA